MYHLMSLYKITHKKIAEKGGLDMVHQRKHVYFHRLLCWVAVWSLLLGLMPPAFAVGESLELPAYNIAILIDKSGSMNTTDKNHLAQEAAKMFVDSLYNETNSDGGSNSSASQVGVIAFADTVETVTEMKEVNSENLEGIKTDIGAIEYYEINTHGTDLGLAVKSATDMLNKNRSDERKNLVILFTDGYTEEVADLKQSAQDLADGLKAAETLESEIFVIGLNYEGRIKEKGKEEIWNIANSTQRGGGLVSPDEKDRTSGKANYLVTDSMQKIKSFYIRLFSYLMEAQEPVTLYPEEEPPTGPKVDDRDKWNFYKINVTSSSIALVKIYILSEEPIGEVALWNPSGDRVDAASQIQDGTGYKLLTLSQPELGSWYVGTLKKVDYDVKYIFISGVRFNMDLERTGVTTGDVRISASYGGEPLTDLFQEQTVSALCTVTPEESGTPLNFELNADPDSGVLSGTFDVPGPDRYWVQTLVSTDQMERPLPLEGILDFDVEATLPAVTVRKGKSVTVDLNEALQSDWEDLRVEITGVDVPADAPAAAAGEGSVLEIQGLRFGETTLTVRASSSLGPELEIACNVQVQRNPLLMILTGVVLLLLVIIAVRWLSRRIQRVPGEFQVVCETVDQPGSPRNLVAQGTEGIRGPSFTLYALIQSALGPIAGDPSVQRMQDVLKEYREELEGDAYRLKIYSSKSRGKTYRYGANRRLGSEVPQEVFRNDMLTISVAFKAETDSEETDDLYV